MPDPLLLGESSKHNADCRFNQDITVNLEQKVVLNRPTRNQESLQSRESSSLNQIKQMMFNIEEYGRELHREETKLL